MRLSIEEADNSIAGRDSLFKRGAKQLCPLLLSFLIHDQFSGDLSPRRYRRLEITGDI